MRLTQLTIAIAVAALVVVLASVSARAEIVLNSPDTPVTVDFNSSIPGIVQVYAGNRRGLMEPNWWERQSNLGQAFHPEGVALMHTFGDFGRGNGVGSLLGPDANGDGDTGDVFGGTVTPFIEMNFFGAGDHVAILNSEGSWANTFMRFRIRNNSGGTLGKLVFGFDVYGRDTTDDSSYSTLYYRYVLSNETNTDAMTFTTLGNIQIPYTAGETQLIASINTTVDVSFAQGDYAVLALDAQGNNARNSVYIDNLSVMGIVPEPGVIGLAALALVAIRRK